MTNKESKKIIRTAIMKQGWSIPEYAAIIGRNQCTLYSFLSCNRNYGARFYKDVCSPLGLNYKDFLKIELAETKRTLRTKRKGKLK